MADYRTFHEDGVLKDILDYISGKGAMDKNNLVNSVIDGTKDFVYGRNNNRTKVVSDNIAKSARSLTAVFPVLVSKSVDIEHAVMVSKAIERKCVGMLQMLFTANQITHANGATDYLRNFHNNISSSLDLSRMDVDDFLKYTEDLGNNDLNEDAGYINGMIQAVNEDVKRNIHHVISNQLTNGSIADMAVSIHESRYSSRNISRKYSEVEVNRLNTNPYHFEDDILRNQDQKVEVSVDNKSFTPNDAKQAVEALSKSIIDGDIKKANEAQASLVIVNFISLDNATKQQIMNTCVIGVKAMIHYVDPQDIVNRVILKQSDSRGLFNLIRATTREISFFKDFLFAVNRAKVDAVARSGRGSTDRIWKLLELRADRLKGAKVSNSNTAAAAAITTLVISKAEVDYIKQFHRIDLSKVGTLTGILRGYNMMAAAIIDEVTERVDFLWDDGTKAFESLSFMSLEREESNAMYKKVINLATRGR